MERRTLSRLVWANVLGLAVGGLLLVAPEAPAADPGAPVATVAPAVSPQTVVRTDRPRCVRGSWSGAPTAYAYAWLRDDVPIPGATASRYTVVADDVGHALRCQVIATNAVGASDPALSASVVPAELVAPTNLSAPSIWPATVAAGAYASCSAGSWSGRPVSYAYAWLRDGVAVPAATRSWYLVTAADVGRELRCRVTATNAAGSTSATSPFVVPVAPQPPQVQLEPRVSPAQPVVGGEASCDVGWWSGNPTGYVISWLRNGTPIAAAAEESYAVSEADAGHALTCVVVAENVAGRSASAVAPAVVPVRPAPATPPPAPVPAPVPVVAPVPAAAPVAAPKPKPKPVPVPVVSPAPGVRPAVRARPAVVLRPAALGPARLGRRLTCNHGTWHNLPTRYTFSWQRAGRPIAGARGQTHTIVRADLGRRLTCRVTARNRIGTTAAVSRAVTPRR